MMGFVKRSTCEFTCNVPLKAFYKYIVRFQVEYHSVNLALKKYRELKIYNLEVKNQCTFNSL